MKLLEQIEQEAITRAKMLRDDRCGYVMDNLSRQEREDYVPCSKLEPGMILLLVDVHEDEPTVTWWKLIKYADGWTDNQGCIVENRRRNKFIGKAMFREGANLILSMGNEMLIATDLLIHKDTILEANTRSFAWPEPVTQRYMKLTVEPMATAPKDRIILAYSVNLHLWRPISWSLWAGGCWQCAGTGHNLTGDEFSQWAEMPQSV